MAILDEYANIIGPLETILIDSAILRNFFTLKNPLESSEATDTFIHQSYAVFLKNGSFKFAHINGFSMISDLNRKFAGKHFFKLINTDKTANLSQNGTKMAMRNFCNFARSSFQ